MRGAAALATRPEPLAGAHSLRARAHARLSRPAPGREWECGYAHPLCSDGNAPSYLWYTYSMQAVPRSADEIDARGRDRFSHPPSEAGYPCWTEEVASELGCGDES